MPDSSNLSDPGREALTLYESNNGSKVCRKRSPSAVATAVRSRLGLAGVFLLIEIPAARLC